MAAVRFKNGHRVFLGDVVEPSLEDDDLRDYFLSDAFGAKPVAKTTDSKTDLREIVREIEELAVFNDEAHHIHNPKMAWFKSIRDIHHKMLQKDCRLKLQIDVTATPRHDTRTTRIEAHIRLQNTRPFRTEHRAFLTAKKSIFNKLVGEAGSSGLELKFAAFLEAATDVAAFAKNYLAIGFKFDYVKADGVLSTYTPDFIARTTDGVVWIIETKGREELDLPQKMARLQQWCANATAAEKNGTRYDFVFVDELRFERHKPASFASLATISMPCAKPCPALLASPSLFNFQIPPRNFPRSKGSKNTCGSAGRSKITSSPVRASSPASGATFRVSGLRAAFHQGQRRCEAIH